MNDYQMTVLAPICPDCGADVSGLLREVEMDWRDAVEARHGVNADAVQQHRAVAHRVEPKIGDVVAYFAAWRGIILGQGPLVVRGIYERAGGAQYRLVNPSRESDYYLPSTNDASRPVSFLLIREYVAPPVETSLFDLLGTEWMETA